MDSTALLLTSLALPLAGALVLGALSCFDVDRNAARWTGLGFALATLLVAALVVSRFTQDAGAAAGFAVTEWKWIDPATTGVDIRFSVGLDGLGVWLYGLSALLVLTSVLVSWEAIEDRPALFYAMLLLLECGCLGVFVARDLLLFYVFFEFTLIPLFFLIGIWGSEERQYAASKFFLFTLAGSLFTFLGLLAIVWLHAAGSDSGTLVFSIPELQRGLAAQPLDPAWQLWIFIALFAGFAIKVPLFPLHTWLPLAHVQAPTAGSVLLAGILLKIGAYGFVRFNLPLLPDATAACMPWLLGLSVAGIIYGALVALAQSDIKRLIAYSSVSHLGFCMLGIFALNQAGLEGALLQMVNHGISTGGLFALVGMIYERYHTRQIADLGGLAARMPVLAFFLLLFTFSSIGLPGLNGFTGEFLVLAGTFQRGFGETPAAGSLLFPAIAVLAVSGVVLGAWYMLWLVQRVFYGPVKEPAGHSAHAPEDHGAAPGATAASSHHDHDHSAAAESDEIRNDLSLREILALAPLVLFVFWIGLAPEQFLRHSRATLEESAAAARAAVAPPTASVSDARPTSPEGITRAE